MSVDQRSGEDVLLQQGCKSVSLEGVGVVVVVVVAAAAPALFKVAAADSDSLVLVEVLVVALTLAKVITQASGSRRQAGLVCW